MDHHGLDHLAIAAPDSGAALRVWAGVAASTSAHQGTRSNRALLLGAAGTRGARVEITGR